MKLTYTIPALTILEAAQLESYLRESAFTFAITPYVDPSEEVAADPEKPRHKLSQAQVVEIYREIRRDESEGKRLKNEQYAEKFGIAPTTVSRIARGEHPELPEWVKKEPWAAADFSDKPDKAATGLYVRGTDVMGHLTGPAETVPQLPQTPDLVPAP
jgi:transcriptional regulator with XRE-family HTH domain